MKRYDFLNPGQRYEFTLAEDVLLRKMKKSRTVRKILHPSEEGMYKEISVFSNGSWLISKYGEGFLTLPAHLRTADDVVGNYVDATDWFFQSPMNMSNESEVQRYLEESAQAFLDSVIVLMNKFSY